MTQPAGKLFRVVTPKSYVYRPKIWLTAVLMLAGIAWVAFVARTAVGLSDFLVEWGIGVLLVLIASLNVIRLVAFRRFLVVNEDYLEVPSRFLKIILEKVDYTEIQRCWEMNLVGTPVLCIATSDKKVEIVSWMLPDLGYYFEIREYIAGKLMSLREQRPEGVPGSVS